MKWILSSIIALLIAVIIFLLVILASYVLDGAMEQDIPEYNYQVFQLLENNEGETIVAKNLKGGDWDRVCFMGPYSRDSSALLGFDWDINQYTNVLDSDGHNVLIFTSTDKVLDFVIQKRSYGDFSDLSGQCFGVNQRFKVLNGGLTAVSE